jgi:hypothetical protein
MAFRAQRGFAQGELDGFALRGVPGQLHELGQHVLGDLDRHFHARFRAIWAAAHARSLEYGSRANRLIIK